MIYLWVRHILCPSLYLLSHCCSYHTCRGRDQRHLTSPAPRGILPSPKRHLQEPGSNHPSSGSHLEDLVITAVGGRCHWHLLERGQGHCEQPATSPARKNCPARMPIVLLLRNSDQETLQNLIRGRCLIRYAPSSYVQTLSPSPL